jgi:Arc/MetJ-type ribon-helix-helix transcriptional regulator
VAPKEKVSLSLDHDLVSEVRRRVGKRELSSFLNEALERRLQAEAIEEHLRDADRRLGPAPADAAAGVDSAYSHRFDRTRIAKLRRRIADAFANAPAAKAALEEAISRGEGIDLLGLHRYALIESILLESIIGAHPRISIHGQSVEVTDVDPALTKRAAAS